MTRGATEATKSTDPTDPNGTFRSHDVPSRTTKRFGTRSVSRASCRGSRAGLPADVSYATESTEPTNRCESSVLSILSPTRQSRFQSRVHVGSTRHRRPKQRDCRFGRFDLVCLPRLPRRAGCRPGRRPRLMVQRHQGHRRTSGGRWATRLSSLPPNPSKPQCDAPSREATSSKSRPVVSSRCPRIGQLCFREWTKVATTMSSARSGHAAVLLPGSRGVLVMGGAMGPATATTDIFHYRTPPDLGPGRGSRKAAPPLGPATGGAPLVAAASTV